MRMLILIVLLSCAAGCAFVVPTGPGPDPTPDPTPDQDGSVDLSPDGGVLDDAAADAPNPADASAGAAWSMGYYYGKEKDLYPVDAVDWTALTHVAAAFYRPSADGSIDETLGLDAVAGPALANALVAAAHANGVKAIASIGGAQSGLAFEGATGSGSLDTFVTSLGALLTRYGYDGLDLDWEPLAPGE